VEISLSTDSAVLFFRFLNLFSVEGAVSPAKFAPPFNDSGQSLKGLKGEYMFTKKEKRQVGEGYFTIIRETERYIEFLFNNTKHCWIICKSLDGTDRPVMIYHKHSRKAEYYHRHWKTRNVAKAVESIKQHDSYVLSTTG
jgi:hypothetical protein